MMWDVWSELKIVQGYIHEKRRREESFAGANSHDSETNRGKG
jgi:hypothetical protein